MNDKNEKEKKDIKRFTRFQLSPDMSDDELDKIIEMLKVNAKRRMAKDKPENPFVTFMRRQRKRYEEQKKRGGEE